MCIVFQYCRKIIDNVEVYIKKTTDFLTKDIIREKLLVMFCKPNPMIDSDNISLFKDNNHHNVIVKITCLFTKIYYLKHQLKMTFKTRKKFYFSNFTSAVNTNFRSPQTFKGFSFTNESSSKLLTTHSILNQVLKYKSAKWHCGRHTLICKKNSN